MVVVLGAHVVVVVLGAHVVVVVLGAHVVVVVLGAHVVVVVVVVDVGLVRRRFVVSSGSVTQLTGLKVEESQVGSFNE